MSIVFAFGYSNSNSLWWRWLFHQLLIKTYLGASPVACGKESAWHCRGLEFDPWLGNEDPTCHGATKPVSHNYWACATAIKSMCHVEKIPHNTTKVWATAKTRRSQINSKWTPECHIRPQWLLDIIDCTPTDTHTQTHTFARMLKSTLS